MKFLVIDDDAGFRKSVKLILEAEGHAVDTAENALDAVTLTQGQEYHFVLVDYLMPERDGIWFMRNVRLPRATRLLLVTAYADPQIINEAFRARANGYMIKPVGKEDMLRHIAFHAAADARSEGGGASPRSPATPLAGNAREGGGPCRAC